MFPFFLLFVFCLFFASLYFVLLTQLKWHRRICRLLTLAQHVLVDGGRNTGRDWGAAWSGLFLFLNHPLFEVKTVACEVCSKQRIYKGSQHNDTWLQTLVLMAACESVDGLMSASTQRLLTPRHVTPMCDVCCWAFTGNLSGYTGAIWLLLLTCGQRAFAHNNEWLYYALPVMDSHSAFLPVNPLWIWLKGWCKPWILFPLHPLPSHTRKIALKIYTIYIYMEITWSNLELFTAHVSENKINNEKCPLLSGNLLSVQKEHPLQTFPFPW